MKTKKLTTAAMLVASGIVGSYFINFPIGAAKCTPVQHIINVFAAVLLGPDYAGLTAFSISLLRNILGSGTLLAFPGSMIGALLAGILYKKTNRKLLAALGEVLGTGVIGAIAAFPIARFLLGKDVALFFFVIPFMINTVSGSIIAYVLLKVTEFSKVFTKQSPGN